MAWSEIKKVINTNFGKALDVLINEKTIEINDNINVISVKTDSLIGMSGTAIASNNVKSTLDRNILLTSDTTYVFVGYLDASYTGVHKLKTYVTHDSTTGTDVVEIKVETSDQQFIGNGFVTVPTYDPDSYSGYVIMDISLLKDKQYSIFAKSDNIRVKRIDLCYDVIAQAPVSTVHA